ncbi:MAG TPA: MlaD family protein [Opitutaceae bacterium]|jgi:paraquat-inducible protein B
MKTKNSPAVVGAFVLGAFVIGLIALLSVGSLGALTHPQRFVVYFDEDVSGLDQGSPVKLRGVRVGHVVSLSIRYSPSTGKSETAVLCELNQGSIKDDRGENLDLSKEVALQGLVDKGLRAQLEIAGLATGLLFVELDFMDRAKHPPRPVEGPQPYVVIPSIPSESSELRASFASLSAGVTSLLAKMEQVDYQGLSVELKRLVVESRTRLEGVDLKGLVAQWEKTGASVDALARSPQALKTFENLNATLDALRTSMGRVDGQVDANGKALQATLEQARATLLSLDAAARTAHSFINAQQNIGPDATRALQRVADAAESVQQLADFLERNPNALVAGRKGPQ